MVFLNHDFCQFNPELQVIFQYTVHRIEDIGIPNCLAKEVVGFFVLLIFLFTPPPPWLD
jgi:hypothetical protein